MRSIEPTTNDSPNILGAGSIPISTDSGRQAARRHVLEIVLIAAVVLLSRLPFLAAGHGADPDAWRVASAARTLATTGRYVASRLPGYPVQEMTYALLWPASPFGFNLLTAIFSAGAVAFFACALRQLGCKDAGLAGLALAFTPVVFINSTNSLDYVWALAFLIASLCYTLASRPLIAGMFLGLAIGCRITSGALLLPLALLLFRPEQRRSSLRQIGRLILTASIVGLLCFSPVLAVYGPDFFAFAETIYPELPELLARGSIDIWGSIGTVILLAALGTLAWGHAPRQARSIEGLRPRYRAACAMAIGLYVIAFLRLPIEPGYLIPAVPFTIILLAAYLARPVFQLLCIALLLTSFVSVGRQGISRGMVFADHEARIVAAQEVNRIVGLGNRLRDRSVVVVGPLLPQIEFTIVDNAARETIYAYALDAAEAGAYRAEGRRIYFYRGMQAYNRRVHGVDLEQFGATQLVPGNRGSEQLE